MLNRSVTMSTLTTEYSAGFYDSVDATSSRSAQVVVPLVMNLISPSSVVDVGCGRGTWLAEFAAQGVERLLGLDSHHVDQNALAIDRENFRVVDLSKPFVVNEKFDLAVCLEVAEHLPTRMSRNLVRQLTSAAPVVLFSAAVPGQGGTRHINEQWHWYWNSIFSELSYDCFDVLRDGIFSNHDVSVWFRQNIFLYASRGSAIAARLRGMESSMRCDLCPISPNVLLNYMTVGGLIKSTRQAIFRSIKNQLVRLITE